MRNLIIFFSFSFFLICSALAEKTPEIFITSFQVRQEEFFEKYTSIGKCVHNNSINYHAKAPGVIQKISAKEGQQIKKGELILTMDASVAKSKLKYLETLLTSAETNLTRAKQLVTRGIVSNKQVEEAEVELNKVRHENSQIQKEYNEMIISAEIDGRIGIIEAVIGQNIKLGDYLFSIVGGNSFQIIAEVPEFLSSKITNDTEVRLVNSNNETGEGKIASYASYVTDKGTLPIKIESAATNNFLHGSYLKVELKFNKHFGKAVPEKVVLKNDKGNFVYKIKEDNTVEQVFVEVGLRTDGMCEILGDEIKEGDLVVLNGLIKVYPNAKVKMYD